MIPVTLYDFWHAPIGFISLALLLLCSLYNVVSPTVEDGLFDRLFRWAIILASSAALFSLITGVNPHHIAITIIIALAARMTVSTFQRIRKRLNSKKPPEEC